MSRASVHPSTHTHRNVQHCTLLQQHRAHLVVVHLWLLNPLRQATSAHIAGLCDGRRDGAGWRDLVLLVLEQLALAAVGSAVGCDGCGCCHCTALCTYPRLSLTSSESPRRACTTVVRRATDVVAHSSRLSSRESELRLASKELGAPSFMVRHVGSAKMRNKELPATWWPCTSAY